MVDIGPFQIGGADIGPFQSEAAAVSSISDNLDLFLQGPQSSSQSGSLTLWMQGLQRALYVCDASEKAIYEVGLDGSNPTQLFNNTIQPPYFPVYHSGINTFFYAQTNLYSINYNGSGETLIVDNATAIHGFDVDQINNKLYYSLSNSGQIRKCDLDGGNDTLAFSPTIPRPNRIKLDIAGGKIYWTSQFPGLDTKILRANLDGSEEETITTEADISTNETVEQMDLDLVDWKIYWANSTEDKVKRADLDGSNKETIYTSAGPDVWGSAIDRVGGKVYWTEGSPKNVKRANLDGSSPEIIWSGSTFPAYLYITPPEPSPSGSITDSLDLFLKAIEPQSGNLDLWIQGSQPDSPSPTEVPLRIIHRMTRTGDYDPQLIGSLSDDVSSVNIRVWDIVDGVNVQVAVASSGCYAIGDTNRWGWSTEHLPFASGYHNYHYYYEMIANNNETDYGEFFLTVPEHGRWVHP